MFFAIIMSISYWLYEISLKKSLDLSRLSQRNFLILGQSIWFILVAYLILSWKVDYSRFYDFKTAGILSLIALLWWLSEFFKQLAYDNDKISTLLPYSNLTPVLLILFWYLTLRDSSFTSFLIALATTLIILIDWFLRNRNQKFSKGVIFMLLTDVCDVSEMILTAYIIKSLPIWTFMMWALSVYYLIAIIIVFHWNSFKEMITQDRKFYIVRLISSVLWYLYWFFEVFLYQEIGIVITTLLSLLSMLIVLVWWYFILDDKPEIRDIILTLIVIFWVGVWFYFN